MDKLDFEHELLFDYEFKNLIFTDEKRLRISTVSLNNSVRIIKNDIIKKDLKGLFCF